MVVFWDDYIDVPEMASSWMVPCQVCQERGSLVESSEVVYVVERILPYYDYLGVRGNPPMSAEPTDEMV